MEKKTLHMNLVQEKLDTLALATAYKVEREWPSHLRHLPFAQGFFGLTLRLSRSTYRTVCYLCADQRRTEFDWRWEYTLGLPALNRTILDSLFNVIFMLEDVETKSSWYLQSGWRESRLEHERYLRHYAGASDPGWATWFEGVKKFLDEGVKLFGISAQEVGSPAIKPDWPNPGKMVYFGVDPNNLPPDRQFLQYMNDWFYRELSAQAHSSFFGLMKLGALVLGRELPEEQADKINLEFFPHHLAIQVSRTTILLLCLVSEVERYFKFGLGLRILDIWQVLSDAVPEAKEVFNLRYAALWSTTQ